MIQAAKNNPATRHEYVDGEKPLHDPFGRNTSLAVLLVGDPSLSAPVKGRWVWENEPGGKQMMGIDYTASCYSQRLSN
jgi:hypothetical protein